MKVLDEPFYGYYLSHIENEKHPGHKEILANMPKNFDEVLAQIEGVSLAAENVFMKNMTHHFFNQSVDFMSTWRNIIFIRDPKAIIHSFSKVIRHPKMQDIGIKMQLEVFDNLSRDQKEKPIVLDSADLLNDPLNTLATLCNLLNISFDHNMLQWPKGPRKEDGIWAKYWYKNVHESTGFAQPSNKEIKLSGLLGKLAAEAQEYYLELTKHKIKIIDATAIQS